MSCCGSKKWPEGSKRSLRRVDLLKQKSPWNSCTYTIAVSIAGEGQQFASFINKTTPAESPSQPAACLSQLECVRFRTEKVRNRVDMWTWSWSKTQGPSARSPVSLPPHQWADYGQHCCLHHTVHGPKWRQCRRCLKTQLRGIMWTLFRPHAAMVCLQLANLQSCCRGHATPHPVPSVHSTGENVLERFRPAQTFETDSKHHWSRVWFAASDTLMKKVKFQLLGNHPERANCSTVQVVNLIESEWRI